jgi:hypothetical protein
MPAETVPNHDIRYHLVAFDADGRERPEQDGPHSRAVVAAARTGVPTDVFIFSHGWNGDVPAARRQYGNWLAAMASCTDDRGATAAMAGGFRPLLVGLHWPSQAWGDEELRGASFGAGTAPAPADDAGAGHDLEVLADRYAARLGDSPATRQALRVIFESALQDAAPMTLPTRVRDAYQELDAEAGMGHAGEGAAPGDDREPFDAEATYQACQQEELVSFGDVSLGGVLAPLRVLTFWKMKRRAREFGERGAAELLDVLQWAAPAARVHLMGHSFGCIVASAAVAGPPGKRGARRPVATLVLVQGAMSLWSFCASIPSRPDRPGYFHPIVADGRVDGPILVTTSVHDRAVRAFYPLGARARSQVQYLQAQVDDPAHDRPVHAGRLPVYGGIGTFGIRGPGVDIVDDQLHPVQEAYDLRPHTAYNLDADAVIATGQGVMGAHSDICHPPVAHAVWQAVLSADR